MDYLSGWCKSQRRLDGYTAVVTGGNAGIGRETASDLYSRGARVILACRNIEKAEEAKNIIIAENESKEGTGSLAIEHLDLCSLQSVRSCAFRILEKEPKIQILVNNAGVMMCPKSLTEDGFETQFGSNHLAHAYLTLLLLPRLIKSAPSRIVSVSSILYCIYTADFEDINYERTPYSALYAYACSKIANVMFAKALAMKLKMRWGTNLNSALVLFSDSRIKKILEHNIHNVTTYSLHPGVVKTHINRHFDKTAFFLFNSIFNSIFTKCFWKTPRCGAQTSIYCAVDEECADESGCFYTDCSKSLVSAQCRDDKKVFRLWDLTIKLLKLNNFNPFDGKDPAKDMCH